jgi:hypothetical protein
MRKLRNALPAWSVALAISEAAYSSDRRKVARPVIALGVEETAG